MKSFPWVEVNQEADVTALAKAGWGWPQMEREEFHIAEALPICCGVMRNKTEKSFSYQH